MKYYGFTIKKESSGKYSVRDKSLSALYPNGIYEIEQVLYDTVKDAKRAITGMLDEVNKVL